MAAGVPSGLIAGWAVPVPGFPGAMHPDTKLSDSSVHCGCILTAWGPSFQACLRRPAGWRLAALAALAPAAAPGPGPSPRAPSRNVSDRAGTSSFSGGDDGFLFLEVMSPRRPLSGILHLGASLDRVHPKAGSCMQPPGASGSFPGTNSHAAPRPCCPVEACGALLPLAAATEGPVCVHQVRLAAECAVCLVLRKGGSRARM